MKFTSHTGELLKAASNIFKAVPAKTVIAIYESFLFEVKDGSLLIMGSDGDGEASTILSVTDTEAGAACIPAKMLIELLKTMEDKPVTFSTQENSVTICSENGKFQIPVFKAEEYSRIRAIRKNEAHSIVIPTKTLKESIENSDFAISNDSSIPVLEGICFDILEDRINIVATDRRVLACKSIEGVQSQEPARFIIHGKNTSLLKYMLDEKVENTTVTFDFHYAKFTCGEFIITARLMEGKYPKYLDVIPKDNPFILNAAKSAFEKAVKRVSVCANKESGMIKLVIDSGTMKIFGQDVKYSTSASETVECTYEGEPITIGFKASALLDSLAEITTDNVVMKLKEPRKTAMLEPEGDVQNPLVCILTPMATA